jgi:hypothetical protein
VGASGWGRKVRRGEGARGSTWAMNFAGDACRWTGLRWRISPSSLRLARRGKRRLGRESRGLKWDGFKRGGGVTGGVISGSFRNGERRERNLGRRRSWHVGSGFQWERGRRGLLGWFPSRVGSGGLGPGAAQLGCALLLSFFCSGFFSYFLFYDLFYNFNIWIPNAFKQVSKFL